MSGICGLVGIIYAYTRGGIGCAARKESAKVAVSLCLSRDPRRSRPSHVRPLALVISEDKEFVLDDRSAQCAAKLVPVSAGYAGCRALKKGVAGIIRVRTLEIECRPVDLVGTRLGLRSHDGADGFSEFGIVILRSNLDFVDRVEVRVDHDNPKNRILVIRAVQFEAGSREMLSVRQNLP